MSLSKVTINRSQGGLGRTSDNKDAYSAMLIVDSAGTSGEYTFFTAQDSIDEAVFSDRVNHQFAEYFRFSTAPLYVKTVESTTNYTEALDLARYAGGEARQIGIYDLSGSFGLSDLSAIQTVADSLEADKIPASFFLAKDISGTIEDLADLGAGLNYRASFLVCEDLTTKASLAVDFLGSLGTFLGLASKTAVGESLAWVEKSNVQSGSLYSDFGFVDGTSYTSKAEAMLEALDNKKANFFRRFVGLDGVYPSYDYSAIANTSDFASFQLNKVFDKAYRILNTTFTPKLNSKLKVIEAGKLEFSTIQYFQNLGISALTQMKTNSELSDFILEINADQNVLATDELKVVCKLRPNGTAKFITVQLGFTI
tara:strand:+ start:1402 stop:2505 length:1104 start_codon:yes stop_codon:yes gene_type:complete